MKLDPKLVVEQTTTTRGQPVKQPFKALLAEAKADLQRQPPNLQKRAAASPARTVTARPIVSATPSVAVQQQRQLARAGHELEAQRLSSARAASHELAEVLSTVRTDANEAVLSRSEARLIEFIVKELKGDQRSSANSNPGEPITERVNVPEPTPTLPQAAAVAPSSDTARQEAVSSADQAVALIEKIELFVKSQRPGLALTLNNSLGARVEIERIGPKEIALRLVGHHGPPSADAVSRIRDELRARGLKVGALSVA